MYCFSQYTKYKNNIVYDVEILYTYIIYWLLVEKFKPKNERRQFKLSAQFPVCDGVHVPTTKFISS